MESLLVDAEGQVVTDEGELYVPGSQCFPGYLDPADEAGRFARSVPGGKSVRDTAAGDVRTQAHWYRTGDRIRIEDGRPVHLGRPDDQVKIMGHRIELGDIEAALRRHPGLREALVMTVGTEHGTQIVAAYSGEKTDASARSRWLEERLPAYMAPSRFCRLSALPRNANRKADRLQAAAMMDETVEGTSA